MSARDSESGSSSYKGGSGGAGGLGNGGIGGGMGGGGNYGGGMGGGAGRNGGIGNQTGLTTGNRMYGGVAMGRPGGLARNPGAWGIRPQPQVTQGPLNRPTRPGLLGNPTPAAVAGVNPVPEYVPQLPDMYYPAYTTPETVPGVPSPPATPPAAPKQWGPVPPDFYDWKPPPGMPMNPRWPGQGVNPMSRDPNELSNYSWDGDKVNLRGVAGGQGVKSWDTRGAASPSNRGYGGWNTPGFN